MAYVKNAQPFNEIIEGGNFILSTRHYNKDGNVTYFLINRKIGGMLYHSRSQQNACVAQGSGNCRAFSRQFKELIDKSAFKDTIYNLLPKPRNQ